MQQKQKKGTGPGLPAKNVGKPAPKQEDGKKTVPPSAKGKKVESLKPPKSPDKKLPQDDKNKTKDAKKPSNLKGRKSSITEESEGTPASLYCQESQPYAEPIYEINGQWYTLGNRTLNNLDFSMNEVTDIGLNYLYDAICVQESTNEIASSADGLYGIYRLSLVVILYQLNTIDE